MLPCGERERSGNDEVRVEWGNWVEFQGATGRRTHSSLLRTSRYHRFDAHLTMISSFSALLEQRENFAHGTVPLESTSSDMSHANVSTLSASIFCQSHADKCLAETSSALKIAFHRMFIDSTVAGRKDHLHQHDRQSSRRPLSFVCTSPRSIGENRREEILASRQSSRLVFILAWHGSIVQWLRFARSADGDIGSVKWTSCLECVLWWPCPTLIDENNRENHDGFSKSVDNEVDCREKIDATCEPDRWIGSWRAHWFISKII